MKLKWSHNRELFKKDNKRLFLGCKEEFLGIAANLDIKKQQRNPTGWRHVSESVFSNTEEKNNKHFYILINLPSPTS